MESAEQLIEGTLSFFEQNKFSPKEQAEEIIWFKGYLTAFRLIEKINDKDYLRYLKLAQ